MKKIIHRVNTIKHLKEIPVEFGVEIDVRSFNNKLILSHDPFIHGIEFEDWMNFYNHAFLILNIKKRV